MFAVMAKFKASTGPIDTRLKIPDVALSNYIRKAMKIGEREINQQIIYMLRFAAAQMSAHDLEAGKAVEGDY
jgi:hypothetical protein